MDIREALSQLDPMDNDHWTGNGDPKIDTVKELLGHPVTRQEIVNSAPKFNRENPIIEDDPKEDPPEQEDPPEHEVDRSAVEAISSKEPMEINEFLTAMLRVPVDQLTDVMEVLRVQEQTVIEHRKRTEEMTLRIRQSMMHVKARIQREVPDIDNQKAIREFLNSQQQTRAAKHAILTSVLKGIDIKQLDPRAAIDRAMARKTNRGINRPVHPSR